MTVKHIGITSIAVGVAIALLAVVYTVQANPSFYVVGSATAVATSSLTYLNSTNATTTLYQNYTVAGNTAAMDSATLEVQFTGSSTASAINIAFEYADDYSGTNCASVPTSCDWYSDTLFSPRATSTNQSLVQTNTYSLPFSSTTQGGVVGTTARTNRIINVQTPTQYVRAIITLAPGSLNGAIWARFLPVKERSE